MLISEPGDIERHSVSHALDSLKIAQTPTGQAQCRNKIERISKSKIPRDSKGMSQVEVPKCRQCVLQNLSTLGRVELPIRHA